MVPIQKQKVVIIGHGSTLRLGIVRALAELGCEITVVVMAGFWHWTKILKTYKPSDCYSRYISHVYYCYANDADGLIKLLLDKCVDPGQKGIIIPVSDFSTVAIDSNKTRLSEHFMFPHLLDPSMSIRHWMEKDVQKDLARKIGLNVPNATVVEIKNRSYTIPEEITYPCFTKALVSIVGGKDCFNRCDNKDELCHVLDEIGAKQDYVPVLVEDYKEIDQEYAILGFSDGKNVIIPGVIHILTMSTSHFGVARTGEIVPIKDFEALMEQYKSFVLQTGYVGIFDIDFYYSGNEFYFGEMNLRPGGSGYAITKLGVNLPAMFVRHMRGEDISGMRQIINDSATFVNERMCEDDWCAGAITNTEYRKIVTAADISFVMDESDPRPQKVFNTVHRLLPIKRIAKKILK